MCKGLKFNLFTKMTKSRNKTLRNRNNSSDVYSQGKEFC